MTYHIGIIGGMGPASTVRFLELILAKYRVRLGAIRNSDFPRITLQTVPDSDHMTTFPDRQILSGLSRSIALLENARVAFFVSPCNTVHQFLIHFDCGGLPLLHIADATRIHCRHFLYQRKVLLLSTEQTRNSHMYAPLLSECDAELVGLSTADQIEVNGIIEGVNAGGEIDLLRQRLLQIIHTYNFDTSLFACTELSLLLPAANLNYADSLEALAEATYLVSSGQRTIKDYSISG